MIGDLPRTALETAEVADYSGSIVTRSPFPPEGGSSPGRSAGGLRLRTYTQVGSGELSPTPPTIKSVDDLGGFYLFFLPSRLEHEDLYKEAYCFLMHPLAGSRIVFLITSDSGVGVT